MTASAEVKPAAASLTSLLVQLPCHVARCAKEAKKEWKASLPKTKTPPRAFLSLVPFLCLTATDSSEVRASQVRRIDFRRQQHTALLSRIPPKLPSWLSIRPQILVSAERCRRRTRARQLRTPAPDQRSSSSL